MARAALVSSPKRVASALICAAVVSFRSSPAFDAADRSDAVYPVDVQVTAQDRQGLLRDISEVFSREKINVVGVQTESRKGMARMGFTAEVGDSRQLARALQVIADVPGVTDARRR